MKQTLFLIAAFLYLGFRSFADPFWAVLLYYGLAVLRPQSIWEWSLPPGIRWSLYAALIAIGALVINYQSLRRRVVQKKFMLVLLIYIGLLFGSYLVAFDREIADRIGWEYAKIFIMMIVGAFVITQLWHFRYLAWAIFGGLTYLVYQVNSLYVFEGRMVISRTGYGGLDNNGAGLMLAMVAPFCYHFFLAERRWWRWGYLVCIVPTAHAVMLTYSRGAMLSGIVCGMGMVLTAGRKRLQAALTLAVLGAVVLSLAGKEVQARFMSINAEERDVSQQSRLDSWRAGLRIAADYPLLGVGIRNSNLLTKQYGADLQGRTIHNIYIQIMADSGFPAGAVYILIILLSLRWLHVAARAASSRLEKDMEARWHHHVCKAVFWSLATFAFGGFFLSLEHFELPYLLILMAATAPGLSAATERIVVPRAHGGLAPSRSKPGVGIQ